MALLRLEHFRSLYGSFEGRAGRLFVEEKPLECMLSVSSNFDYGIVRSS